MQNKIVVNKRFSDLSYAELIDTDGGLTGLELLAIGFCIGAVIALFYNSAPGTDIPASAPVYNCP